MVIMPIGGDEVETGDLAAHAHLPYCPVPAGALGATEGWWRIVVVKVLYAGLTPFSAAWLREVVRPASSIGSGSFGVQKGLRPVLAGRRMQWPPTGCGGGEDATFVP